jgi:hypothetical protein
MDKQQSLGCIDGVDGFQQRMLAEDLEHLVPVLLSAHKEDPEHGFELILNRKAATSLRLMMSFMY